MTGRKFWHALRAQMHKLANLFWTADPIANMQYEYELAVRQLKEGRQGLEQYRALVERVARQADTTRKHMAVLEARVQAYLVAGDRETAGRFALELEKAAGGLAENEAQLELHEAAYAENVAKIKLASRKLAEVRERIAHYDAELKMTGAEAEIAKLANTLEFDVTTDFGRIEQVVQDRISLNRAKVRVSADLGSDVKVDLERAQAMEAVMAERALRKFELGTIEHDASAPNDLQKRLSSPDAGEPRP